MSTTYTFEIETEEGTDLMDYLAGGILELPPEQRLVLALHYIEGLSGDQIAQLLDISLDTVVEQFAEAVSGLRLVTS